MREMKKREKKLLKKYVTTAAAKAFREGWAKGVLDGAARERELIVRALLEKTNLSEKEIAEVVGISALSNKNSFPKPTRN